MRYDSVEELKKQGFEGFVTTQELWDSKCRQIPDVAGVYIVFRTTDGAPEYLEKSRAGLYKGKDLTVDVSKLEKNWVPGAMVLYIGKAGGPGIKQGLKKRLQKYMRTGFGKTAGRRGGKILWQLGGASDFVVCWKTDLGTNTPLELETEMVHEFKRQYKKYPFANIDTSKK